MGEATRTLHCKVEHEAIQTKSGKKSTSRKGSASTGSQNLDHFVKQLLQSNISHLSPIRISGAPLLTYWQHLNFLSEAASKTPWIPEMGCRGASFLALLNVSLVDSRKIAAKPSSCQVYFTQSMDSAQANNALSCSVLRVHASLSTSAMPWLCLLARESSMYQATGR
jgi:hypothetical protein